MAPRLLFWTRVYNGWVIQCCCFSQLTVHHTFSHLVVIDNRLGVFTMGTNEHIGTAVRQGLDDWGTNIQTEAIEANI